MHAFSIGSNCIRKDNKSWTCENHQRRNQPILQNGYSKHNMAGQFYQASYVERLLGLNNESRLVQSDS